MSLEGKTEAEVGRENSKNNAAGSYMHLCMKNHRNNKDGGASGKPQQLLPRCSFKTAFSNVAKQRQGGIFVVHFLTFVVLVVNAQSDPL